MHHAVFAWVKLQVGKAELCIGNRDKLFHIHLEHIHSRTYHKVNHDRLTRTAACLLFVTDIVLQQIGANALHGVPRAVANAADARKHIGKV